MADWFMDIVRQTAEYQGRHSTTVWVGTLGTVIFAVYEVKALWLQYKEIRLQQSGKSISIEWMVAGMFVFWSFFLYGLYTGSVASAFNGLFTGLLHIPIVIALYRYEGFTRKQWAVYAVMACSLPIMIFFPNKQAAFGVISIALIGMVAMQPITLLRELSTGDLTIRMLVTYCASAFFWMVYGFAIDDLILKIVCTSNFALLAIATAIWYLLRTCEECLAA